MKDIINSIKKFDPNFKINFLDVGAQGGLQEEWEDTKSIIRTIGFEPVLDKYEILKYKFPEDKWFNTALWSSKSQIDFYETPADDYSSALKPKVSTFSDFGRELSIKDFKIKRINTDTIDNLIDECDFIKLDVQGAELEVLKGAENTLKNVTGLCLEVSFIEVYENQALFGDIDKFLRERGFKFISFYGAMLARTKEARKERGRIARLVGSNAVYIKESDTLKNNILSIIIEATYGLPDLAIKRLKNIPEPLSKDLQKGLKKMIRNTSVYKIPGRFRFAKFLWKLISYFDERPYYFSNKLWKNSLPKK